MPLSFYVFYLFGSFPSAYPWNLILMGLLWPALLVMFGLLVCHLLPYVHISWTILRSLDMLILMNSGCIFLSTSGHLYLHISRLIRGKTKFKSSMTPFFTETSLFFPLSGLLQNSSLSHTHTHTQSSFCRILVFTQKILVSSGKCSVLNVPIGYNLPKFCRHPAVGLSALPKVVGYGCHHPCTLTC